MALHLEADLTFLIKRPERVADALWSPFAFGTRTRRNPTKIFCGQFAQVSALWRKGLFAKTASGGLAGQGLTLEITDKSGSLLILGEGAQGKTYTIPGFGRLEHVALASKRAALRLALNAY